ncbi:MAG: hypothetical protein K2X44_05905 [Magnetospirillum sp.]|nr:hypothetical protein [Magnetospirillum sp.]
MGTIFVATSKAQQDWGSDVGLGKNLFKVGVAEDCTPQEALAGFANQTDWVVLQAQDSQGLTEVEVLERVGRREKLVDPIYYPKLRGALGIVKINLTAIENSMLVALALDGREPAKNFKVKPVDVANHLISNALK